MIGFDGPGSYVKVGSTAAPQDRLLAHLYTARSRGLRLAGLWLSPAHPEYRLIEQCALTGCRAIFPSATPRSEYFPGMPFEQARVEAAKAAYGFRSHPTSSPPSELAAGQHEVLAHYLRRRVKRLPLGPEDAFRFRIGLRRRFAQGSAPTRFLRRNSPYEQQGDLLRLP
ncbi:hypothetical protein ABIE67_009636 [Streptomyces sp. V4I8]